MPSGSARAASPVRTSTPSPGAGAAPRQLEHNIPLPVFAPSAPGPPPVATRQPGPATKEPSALRRARSALIVVVGLLAVLWLIQFVNNADHYRLSISYGIEPRMAADLPHILTAPFLHWSWAHIEGNTLPFLVLGFLAAYRGIPRFIRVTAVVIFTSGMAVWLTTPSGADTVGASGVIFGWFGYVIMRGFFTRNRVDIVVGVLVMLYYLPIFTDLLPAPHLSFEGHIGGLIGGVLCAWSFRTRGAGLDPVASAQ